jgi:hypothetical protein
MEFLQDNYTIEDYLAIETARICYVAIHWAYCPIICYLSTNQCCPIKQTKRLLNIF